MVSNAWPVSPLSSRAPRAARPMATPAWGIRARPRLFRTFGALPASLQPVQAPAYLPRMRTKKYTTPMTSSGTAPMLPELPVRAPRSKDSPLRKKKSSRIGGLK